jgi:hypothetical protein
LTSKLPESSLLGDNSPISRRFSQRRSRRIAPPVNFALATTRQDVNLAASNNSVESTAAGRPGEVPPTFDMLSLVRASFAVVLTVVLCSSFVPSAQAARVAVLANSGAATTATDFQAQIPGHVFTAIDVTSGPPALDALLASYDVVLLFEDGLFANAPAVGTRVAEFALAGRAVVLGTFYEQDRSDRAGIVLQPPHGWGALESIDPNTTDGIGAAGSPRALAPTVVVHPLTSGVTTLFAGAQGYAGGNQAKPGTTVLATWDQPNARGQPDPAIAYRSEGPVCVIHVAIAPNYANYGAIGSAFGGDFYQAWKNAFDFGARKCDGLPQLPALSDFALLLMALGLAALAARRLRRVPAR